ncbi:hypothetical protein Tco_0009792 [Tanacetum coccineum]
MCKTNGALYGLNDMKTETMRESDHNIMKDFTRIDDEVVQDQRQRDDNDLQDERQYQPKDEEVERRKSKRARTKKSFDQFVPFNGKFVRSGCTTALNVIYCSPESAAAVAESAAVVTEYNIASENCRFSGVVSLSREALARTMECTGSGGAIGSCHREKSEENGVWHQIWYDTRIQWSAERPWHQPRSGAPFTRGLGTTTDGAPYLFFLSPQPPSWRQPMAPHSLRLTAERPWPRTSEW